MDFVKDYNSYGKIVIASRDYFDLIRADRDLEILRKSYMDSPFGISADVLTEVVTEAAEDAVTGETNHD